MYFRHVQTLQRKHSFIPLFATSVVLGIALSLYYYLQTQGQVKQQFTDISALAAQLSSAAIQNKSIVEIENTLSALMQYRDIKSVRLSDREQNIIGHLGQGFLIKMPELDWFKHDIGFSDNERMNICRVVHPVLSPDQGELVGWVEIGFDRGAARFAFFDIMIGIAILCLVLPAIMALYLQERSARARSDVLALQQGISLLADGDYNNTIQVAEKSVLAPVARDINAIATSVRSAQSELKKNIEHNIDELRETMETIEIQNIELDLARKRALEASRVKSEFLANASHEFRTPLNGIIGFTQLLLKADISETQQEFLRTIETSAQGLLTIINDILDISHIEAGTVNLDYIPMRLETVLEETQQILAPTAFQQQHELIALIDQELPQELISDPLRLKQILTNLLTTAVQHSANVNVVIKVSQGCSGRIKPKSAKSIVFRFAIEGIKADAPLDQLLSLQERYSDNTDETRTISDIGFGFAISQGLILALGGTLGVEQQAHQQTLWFELPLDQGQKSKPYLEKALTGLAVIVCCSNSQTLAQIKQIIANWKLNIDVLTDPLEVLPLLQQSKQSGKFYQLLLMDVPVNESNTTATSFLDQITYQADSEYHCKTVLLTTPSKQRELIEAELNRSVAFAPKPLIRARLYKSICNHLNIYKHIYNSANVQLLKDPQQKPKILAVDDNPANLMLVREFLVNLGSDVSTAASGKDAIELCNTTLFDLIFMDIQMPGLDGIETTKAIRAAAPKGVRTPVVALTAHAVNDRKSELLLAGLDDYLSKPVTEEQLAHVIQRWCNNTSLAGRKNKPKLANPRPKETLTMPTAQPLTTAKLANLSETKIGKPVDVQMCLTLAGNKPDLAHKMLTMLIESLPETLQNIALAQANNNFLQLEDTVHKLRGGAKYTGAPQLAEIAASVDKQLHNKQYLEVDSNVQSLTNAIHELSRWADEVDIDSLFD